MSDTPTSKELVARLTEASTRTYADGSRIGCYIDPDEAAQLLTCLRTAPETSSSKTLVDEIHDEMNLNRNPLKAVSLMARAVEEIERLRAIKDGLYAALERKEAHIKRLNNPPFETTDDYARLEWAMRNVSGAEWRRLGVLYGDSAGIRRAIDIAMRSPEKASDPHVCHFTGPEGFCRCGKNSLIEGARAAQKTSALSGSVAVGLREAAEVLRNNGLEYWAPACERAAESLAAIESCR